jgi:hypothetical protein
MKAKAVAILVLTMALGAVPAVDAADSYEIETFLAEFGSSGVGPGQFTWLVDLAVDGEGNVYAGDTGYTQGRVHVFDNDGTFLAQLGAYSSAVTDYGFKRVCGVAVDPYDRIYVSDDLHRRIMTYDRSGSGASISFGYVSQFPVQFQTEYGYWSSTYPYKITFDSWNDIFVGGYWARKVIKYLNSGTFLKLYPGPDYVPYSTAGQNFCLPISVGVDSSDNLYVVEHYASGYCSGGSIVKFAPDGSYLMKFGTLGTGEANTGSMSDIAIDDNDILYVTDGPQHRVLVFTSEGEFLGWFGKGTATTGWHDPGSGEGWLAGSGPGEFVSPCSIVIDGAGNVYVADAGSSRIQKFSRRQLTPEEQCDILLDEVAELTAEGTLNGGQGHALTVKLEKVLERISQGKIRQAINMLGAFMNQVADFVENGLLTPEEGDRLIGIAESIIADLGG